MRFIVHLYVLSIAALACGVGAALYMVNPAPSSELSTAAVVFALLGLLANKLNHDLARGAGGSMAFIPFVTAALVAPHWVAVASVAAAVATNEVIAQRAWLKKLFNTAQYALSIGLATSVYLLLGGKSLLTPGSFSPLPYAALFVTFLLVNSIAVSGAIAVSERASVWQIWRQNTLRSAAYDLLALPVAYFFAWFFREHGVVGAFTLAIPLVVFRQLYKTHWQLELQHQELLQIMVAAIEARDPYTSGHSRRVARNAKLIARILGCSSKQIEQIEVAALLHDVGKIHEVFAPILRKPDRLTAEEWAVMQTHPVKSAELVQHVSRLRYAVPIVRHHHENWDGSGYPDKIAGASIPLGSRIIIFADTIDAMTSDRPYRKAMTEVEVRAEFVRMRGRQFDPAICDKLLASPQFGLLFTPLGQPLSSGVTPGAPQPTLLTPGYAMSVIPGRRAI